VLPHRALAARLHLARFRGTEVTTIRDGGAPPNKGGPPRSRSGSWSPFVVVVVVVVVEGDGDGDGDEERVDRKIRRSEGLHTKIRRSEDFLLIFLSSCEFSLSF
jgi:hypothetical protein